MKKDITITAELRNSRGKNEARRLRVAGRTPAIVYGAGSEAVAVAVNPKEVNRILNSNTGQNTIFTLAIQEGATRIRIGTALFGKRAPYTGPADEFEQD